MNLSGTGAQATLKKVPTGSTESPDPRPRLLQQPPEQRPVAPGGVLGILDKIKLERPDKGVQPAVKTPADADEPS